MLEKKYKMKGLQNIWYVIILIFILPNVLLAQTNVNVGWSRVSGLGGGDVEALTKKVIHCLFLQNLGFMLAWMMVILGVVLESF